MQGSSAYDRIQSGRNCRRQNYFPCGWCSWNVTLLYCPGWGSCRWVLTNLYQFFNKSVVFNSELKIKGNHQGCAQRKTEESPLLWTCEIQGAQHIDFCEKKVIRFPSWLRAKGSRQGLLGSARAQPCWTKIFRTDGYWFDSQPDQFSGHWNNGGDGFISHLQQGKLLLRWERKSVGPSPWFYWSVSCEMEPQGST